MNRSHDRNLLLGLMAVKLEFINQDQLVLGMTEWAKDTEQALTETLTRLGYLNSEEQDLLEALVERQIARHDGVVSESLARLSSIDPKVTQALQGIPVEAVQESLRHISRAGGAADAPTGSFHLRPSSANERFRILRPHRKGGLGEVFVARDDELHRDVALKEIQTHHADSADSRARFMMEAEITGRLEHPGIVPVYGLGTYANGRPFYAMRFIQGDSLQEAVDSFHAKNPDGFKGGLQGNASLAFRELLGRFVDICQAMEYAHSRGVLHRDLKPGNIMLGRYGETLVVDWGLAKAHGNELPRCASSSRPLAPSLIQPRSGSNRERTLHGSAVGTPGYMSPEQAAGRVEELTVASDIYGLGATLYHLLTGRAPFQRETDGSGDVLAAVQRGEFPPPRAIRADVPRALEAICLRAMSLQPSDRYATALEIAGDIERYLADEPVSSFRESWRHRFQRWVRRHPVPVAGVVAGLCVGAVAAGIVAHLATRHALEVARQERRIRAQSENLRIANAKAESRRKEAERARKQADLVSEFLVSVFERPDPAKDGTQVTVASILGKAEQGLAARSELSSEARADLLHAISRSYQGMGMAQDAIRVAQREYDILRDAHGEDDSRAAAAAVKLATLLCENGDSGQGVPLLERAYAILQQREGVDAEVTLRALDNYACALTDAGDLPRAIQLHTQAHSRMVQVLGTTDQATLAAENNLAQALFFAGQPEKALPHFQSVFSAWSTSLDPKHPLMMRIRHNLANSLLLTGKGDQAIPLLEQVAADARDVLGPEHPDTLMNRGSLAAAYCELGRAELAIPLMESDSAVMERTLGDTHPNTLMARGNLALAYREAGMRDKVLPLLESTTLAMRDELGIKHAHTHHLAAELVAEYMSAKRGDEALALLESCANGSDVPTADWLAETMNQVVQALLADESSGTKALERALALGNLILDRCSLEKRSILEKDLAAMKAQLP